MRLRVLPAALVAVFAVAWQNNNTPEGPGGGWNKASYPIRAPRLERAPLIDGDLAEWKYRAFSDGLWDIVRVAHTPWYDPGRNRVTQHGNEPRPGDDLSARYYAAWDRKYLYLGAEVHDNVNDVEDPAHAPERWYYKDSICWFIEAPRDERPERFGQGDNAFCFLADARKPPHGAWWRHGSATRRGIEEPLPKSAVEYALRMNPWGEGPGDFILEARVEMSATLGASDPAWRPPQEGDVYGFEIVHCDPDGGGYGGHLMLYGTGDHDESWGLMTLTGPLPPLERKPY